MYLFKVCIKIAKYSSIKGYLYVFEIVIKKLKSKRKLGGENESNTLFWFTSFFISFQDDFQRTISSSPWKIKNFTTTIVLVKWIRWVSIENDWMLVCMAFGGLVGVCLLSCWIRRSQGQEHGEREISDHTPFLKGSMWY